MFSFFKFLRRNITPSHYARLVIVERIDSEGQLYYMVEVTSTYRHTKQGIADHIHFKYRKFANIVQAESAIIEFHRECANREYRREVKVVQ